MKKKILAGVMLATMIFSLTACGSSEGNTSSGKNDSVATTEKKSDESKKVLTDAGWKVETPNN